MWFISTAQIRFKICNFNWKEWRTLKRRDSINIYLYCLSFKAIANRFVLHNGIGKNYSAILKFEQSLAWAGVCPVVPLPHCPVVLAGTGQSLASHVICIVLPRRILCREAEMPRFWVPGMLRRWEVGESCRMLLLLSTIFYVPIGKIYIRDSREVEIQLSNSKGYHRLSTWVLSVKLVAGSKGNKRHATSNNMHKNCLFNLLRPKQIA